MKIAVTFENGMVFPHFGHTAQFKVYDSEDGKVTNTQVVSTEGSGHGALAGLLSSLEVDTLICGGIGGGAQAALAEAGIQLYGGVSGGADEAVIALLTGKLEYNPDVRCEHHGHHEEGHSCGEDKRGCAGNGGECH
ncbi:dinitrogenase iron-molybdenum cofactor biosynthesis protein [bacterium D16-51]|nr:dinitrogenase iron-molybdenum cofactor biosynthesis protein [bacterium D16-59]RKI59523.1 dinitrogenase iron-molybdenum cofactor biosynthesis protein [bacterium D16-51]